MAQLTILEVAQLTPLPDNYAKHGSTFRQCTDIIILIKSHYRYVCTVTLSRG